MDRAGCLFALVMNAINLADLWYYILNHRIYFKYHRFYTILSLKYGCSWEKITRQYRL